MALQTRINKESGEVEVLVGEEWLPFTSYREQQIDEAYDKSVKFLRDRLGEEYEEETTALKEKNGKSE